MKDIFLISLKAIMVNKVRSFLTTLGVIIGVGSVVLLTAIGNGLSAYVTQQFNELGANNLIIFPNDIFESGGGFSSESAATSVINSKLRLRHVAEVQRLREYVTQVIPFNMQATKIGFKEKEKSVTIMGTTAEIEKGYNIPTGKGRFFSDGEERGGKRVIVLGFKLADELFGQVDPIGKTVKVGGQAFRVIGVAQEKGSGLGGPNFDTYAYIPLQTFARSFDSEVILRIIVKINDTKNLKEAKKKIEETLSKNLKDDEYSVIDQAEILKTINQILGVLTIGLGGIAAISLVVGGIGIMNIMLVSVTERTREIGLRKAVGATPNVILLQFLIEAALLSCLGGIVGVGIAFLGTLAVQSFIPAVVTPQAVALAFGVSVTVGLVFGVAPARRAANLSPIEALRYE